MLERLGGARIGGFRAVLPPAPQGSLEDRRVDQRAFSHHQTLGAQGRQRLIEQGRAVTFVTKPLAEPADRTVVGGLVVERQADETPEADAVLEHLLGHRIPEPKPLLHQHHLEHRDQRPVRCAALRPVGGEKVLNRPGQLAPGYLAFAHRKEGPGTRPAQIGGVGIGKRRLGRNAFHRQLLARSGNGFNRCREE